MAAKGNQDNEGLVKDGMKAVVLFSGGQDSTTCLAWALRKYGEGNVEAVAFSYGQRHSVELFQARIIADLLHAPFRVLHAEALGELGDSNLLREGSVSAPHPRLPHLPASFVPNRNGLFLLLAHAFAQKVGASVLVTGTCQTDYSGYPDCRAQFVQSFVAILNLGSDARIEVETPLMYLSKAETFAMSNDLGCLGVVIDHSHTCYEGNRNTSHAWGDGCGRCPACKLRAKGWKEYKGGLGQCSSTSPS